MDDNFNPWKEYLDAFGQNLQPDRLFDNVSELVKRQSSLEANSDQELLSPQTAEDVLVSAVPGLGAPTAVRDFERARREGSMLGMGLSALGVLPFGSLVGKAAGKLTSKVGLLGGAHGAIGQARKAIKTVEANPEQFLPGSAASRELGAFYDPVAKQAKYYVPDVGAKLNLGGISDVPRKLGEVLDHPEFVKAYGGMLNNTKVAYITKDNVMKSLKAANPNVPDHQLEQAAEQYVRQAQGYFNPTDKTIYLRKGENELNSLSTILHEQQHGIQRANKQLPEFEANANQVRKTIEKKMAESPEKFAKWRKEVYDSLPEVGYYDNTGRAYNPKEVFLKGTERGASEVAKEQAAFQYYLHNLKEAEPRWVEKQLRADKALAEAGATTADLQARGSRSYANLLEDTTTTPLYDLNYDGF